MNKTIDIKVTKAQNTRTKNLDWENLEFGRTPSDHMFACSFKNGKWQEPEIRPFENLSLSPFSACFHYGQTIFEGLKAFRQKNGDISIFRPEKNHERMVLSAERMCMPAIPEEIFMEGLHSLIELDQDWVPKKEGHSLYIRPFMIATEPVLKVSISNEYLFLLVTTPVGPYYEKPLNLKVETKYVRAAEGGVGYAKCGGNYGGSYYPFKKAQEEGFDQVIWTDSRTNSYVEESGTMNIMMLINNTLVTPATSTSILNGITRNTILTLAQDLGVKTEERPISIKELEKAAKDGSLKEAFGAGTAAFVAPIGKITFGKNTYDIPFGENSFASKIKKIMGNIRSGESADEYGWNYIIPSK